MSTLKPVTFDRREQMPATDGCRRGRPHDHDVRPSVVSRPTTRLRCRSAAPRAKFCCKCRRESFVCSPRQRCERRAQCRGRGCRLGGKDGAHLSFGALLRLGTARRAFEAKSAMLPRAMGNRTGRAGHSFLGPVELTPLHRRFPRLPPRACMAVQFQWTPQ
jgi:hypothetical protein